MGNYKFWKNDKNGKPLYYDSEAIWGMSYGELKDNGYNKSGDISKLFKKGSGTREIDEYRKNKDYRIVQEQRDSRNNLWLIEFVDLTSPMKSTVSFQLVDLYGKGKIIPSQETYYISYLNKDNNFKQTEKEFKGVNAFEDAMTWGRANLGNFNSDMIRMKHAKGTTISGKEVGLHLPIEMSVYVPSTKDASVPISKSELDSRVKQVKEYLANLFGGYSSSEVVGGYASNEGALIQEDVVKVISFATKKAYQENKQKLIDKIAEWSTKWSQEAIGFELEGDLYYINQDKIMAKGGNTDCGCWHYEIGGLW